MFVPKHNPAPVPPPVLQLTSADDIPWAEASVYAHEKARQSFGLELGEDVAQEALKRLHTRRVAIEIGWKPYLAAIVANVGRTRLRDKSRQARVCCDSAAVDGALSSDPEPSQNAVAEEAEAVLPLLLDQLDREFGRGTKAIVDLRSKLVPWQEISKIVKLRDRTCRYRHEHAYTWVCKRLSLLRAKRRNGGCDD